MGTQGALPCRVFQLGPSTLHQLHAAEGRVFVMGEVASELFNEVPAAFLTVSSSGAQQRWAAISTAGRGA
jgi:hypothetical protein